MKGYDSMLDSMDITFCRGMAEQEINGNKVSVICPVRDNCHRFWTEEHSKEALRTGDIYHSFFVMDDVNYIKEDGCENFWRER